MNLLPFLIYAGAGIAAGLLARLTFMRMPDSWLLDYDQTEVPDGFAQQRSFPLAFQGIVFTALMALLFARIPAAVSDGWQAAAAVIAIPVLLLILVADWKTRIIPDQLTLLLIVPGLVRLTGSLIAGETLIKAVGLPMLSAVIAGGSLLLIGLIGQLLMRREAMGMGDVKMIATAAFLVGLADLPALVILSFLTAAVVAIPLLVRRTVREHRAVKNSDSSESALSTVESTPAAEETVFVEDTTAKPPADPDPNPNDGGLGDDTAIAFGPFIAISALLLILFHQPINQLVSAYWSLFSR